MHRKLIAPQILLVNWTAVDGTAGSFYTLGDSLGSNQTNAVAVDRGGAPIPGAPAPTVPACAAIDLSVVGFQPLEPPTPGAPAADSDATQQEFAALLWGVPSLSGPVWRADAARAEPGRPGVCGLPLCSADFFRGCATPGADDQDKSCVMPFAYCTLPGSAQAPAAPGSDAPPVRLEVVLPAVLAAVAFAVAVVLAALLLRRRRRQHWDAPAAAPAARSMSLRSLVGKDPPGKDKAQHVLAAAGIVSGGVVSSGVVVSGGVVSGAVSSGAVGAMSDALKDDGSSPSQHLPSSLENLAAYGIFVEAASTSARSADAGPQVDAHVPSTIDEMVSLGVHQPLVSFELQGTQCARVTALGAGRAPACNSVEDAFSSDEYASLWARLAGAQRHPRPPGGRVVATRNACYVSSTQSPRLWQTPSASDGPGDGARALSTKAPSETRSVNLSMGELDSLVSAGSGRFNWCSLDTETKSLNELSLLRSLRAVPLGGALLPSSQDGAWTQAELQEQLLEMRERRLLLAGRYQLTGEFASGGQGLVAFASVPSPEVGKQGTRNEVAIKFPLNRQAFSNEVRVSSHPVFKAHVPELVEVRASTVGLLAPNHRQLPVFLVLPRGEPLDEFVQKHRPGPLQCVLVLVLLAEKLAALHEDGLVHRDVKPANSVWLPLHHTWTLIDYGSAAMVETENPVALTPRYGAPELALCVSERRETTVVRAATDVWSLGVMSYELLAAEDAFSSMPAHDYWQRLLGGGPLPWEQGERLEAMKVGEAFVRVIRQMLSRNPDERPSMREVVRGWKQAINLPE